MAISCTYQNGIKSSKDPDLELDGIDGVLVELRTKFGAI